MRGSQELSVSTKSIPGQDNDSYVILGESGVRKECCCPKYRAAKGPIRAIASAASIFITPLPRNISFQFSESHLNICPQKLMHTTRQFQQRSSIHYAMRMELRNHQQI